jgi:hypothetical protein
MATINVYPPGAAGSISVQDEGTAVATQPTLNFIGAGVTATDDAGNNRVNVTIPGVAGATDYMTFATIAALGAAATAGLDDQSVAWVCTVADEWVLHKSGTLSTATVDGITCIAALDGGRWIRQGKASEEWIRLSKTGAGVATWFINGTTGSDEATGITAGAPIRTGAELDRRIHGLMYREGEVVTITVAAAPADGVLPITFNSYSSGQAETLRIVGTRVVAASGSVTAATAQASGTDTQGDVTLSVDVSAHLGKYIRFFSAGPTFRCSSWLADGSGLGPYQLFTTVDENGAAPTSIVTPVAADTFEVYNFPAFDLNVASPTWAAGVNVINCEILSSSGYSHLDNDSQSLVLYGSKISGKIYDANYGLQMENSIMAPPEFPEGSFFFEAGGIFDAAKTGTAYFGGTFGNGGSTTLVFNRFNPILSGCRLSLFNCEVTPNSTNGFAFFQTPASGYLITLDGASIFSTGLVWGSAAVANFMTLVGAGNKAAFTAAPSVATAVNLNFAADAATALVSDLSSTGIKDTQGNEAWLTTVGACLGDVARVSNQSGATLAPGDVVRSNGTTGQVTSAINTDASTARVDGVSLGSFANASNALVATGYVWVDHTGAPTINADSYISGTSRKATTTFPSISSTVQHVSLGRVLAANGTLGLVYLRVRAYGNEVIEQPVVLTDGATVTIDPTQGRTFVVTLGGNRTLDISVAPTTLGWPKKFTMHIIQDGTGGRTLTPTTGAGKFLFGTDVTSLALTATANAVDIYAFEADMTLNRWLVTARSRGFV